MLGYVIHDEATDPNGRMAALAARLGAEGWRLAGAVQANIIRGPDCACDMELAVLGADAAPIRISQSLGAGSMGCRLDSDALERAAGLAAAVLDGGADLIIVNKFGKQEAIGRGFRDLIGAALTRGVPVLTAVAPDQLAAFREFADGMEVALDWDSVEDWCQTARVAA